MERGQDFTSILKTDVIDNKTDTMDHMDFTDDNYYKKLGLHPLVFTILLITGTILVVLAVAKLWRCVCGKFKRTQHDGTELQDIHCITWRSASDNVTVYAKSQYKALEQRLSKGQERRSGGSNPYIV